MSDKLILDNSQIAQKIRRMAYEIYENNYNAKELTILGIKEQGYDIAEALLAELKSIFPIKFHFIPIEIDKSKPESYLPEMTPFKDRITSKTIILVDDVLNSGRTLMYAMNPFLVLKPSSIQVAVLINRDHKIFPIQADYVGLSLATTIKEHVIVETNKKGTYRAFMK